MFPGLYRGFQEAPIVVPVVESILAANFTMTNAATDYDPGLSVNLDAGRWIFNLQLLFQTANVPLSFYWKIWDGVNTAFGEGETTALTSNTFRYTPAGFGYAELYVPTTVKVTTRSDKAGQQVLRGIVGGFATSNKATRLIASKVGSV
jgi:hypothetical protein